MMRPIVLSRFSSKLGGGTERLGDLMRRLVMILVFLAASTAGAAEADEAPSFTEEQATRGEDIYFQFCLQCHGANLSDGEFGAPIRGSFFRGRWDGKSLAELMTFMTESMPPEDPGYLYPEEYADVMAYILKRNEVAPGDAEIPPDPAAVQNVILHW
jgi:mono/diheme cytochrome c family protein